MSGSGSGAFRHLLLLFVVGISALAAGLHLASNEILTALCREDGPIEWATAGFFLFAGLAFALRGAHGARRPVFAFGLSALCIFVAGEEVSWGQRIFGFNTPGYFAEHNVQGETNVHNLIGIHDHIRAMGMLSAFAMFVLVPIGTYVLLHYRNKYLEVGIPVHFYHVWIVVVAILFQAAPRFFYGEPVFNLDEMGEFLFSIAFLALATDKASWARQCPAHDVAS